MTNPNLPRQWTMDEIIAFVEQERYYESCCNDVMTPRLKCLYEVLRVLGEHKAALEAPASGVGEWVPVAVNDLTYHMGRQSYMLDGQPLDMLDLPSHLRLCRIAPVPALPQALVMPDWSQPPIVFPQGSPEHKAISGTLAQVMSDLSEEAYFAGWMSGCEYDIWSELQAGREAWYIRDGHAVITLKLLSGMIDGWIAWDEEIMDTRYYPTSEWLAMYDKWMRQRPAAQTQDEVTNATEG